MKLIQIEVIKFDDVVNRSRRWRSESLQCEDEEVMMVELVVEEECVEKEGGV